MGNARLLPCVSLAMMRQIVMVVKSLSPERILSNKQVEDVYRFMNSLLKKHYDIIVYREPYMALVVVE